MKKLFAVLAVFVMVTTAAFAQASVNGVIRFHGEVLNNTGNPWTGTPESYSLLHDTFGRAFAHEGRFGMNVSNGEGTAGGGLRMWINDTNFARTDAWAWWQPMHALRIQAGRDPWRIMGEAAIVGWAFYGGAAGNAEDVFMRWGWAGAAHYGAQLGPGNRRLGRVAGFYGGFGGTGLAATIRPIEGTPLTIIAILPWHDVDNEISEVPNWAASTLLNAHLGVRYVFQGVGQLNFTWWGAPGHWGWGRDGDDPVRALDPVGYMLAGSGVNQTNSSRFFLSFHFNQLPALLQAGIQLNLGVAYTLPFVVQGATADDDVTTNYPIEAGLGFLFSQGPFRFAARFAGTFAGSVDGNAIPMLVGANIHPSLNLGAMTVHLAAGVQFLAENVDSNHGTNHGAYLGWHVAPFISRSIAGPVRLMTGVHVQSNGSRRDGDTGDMNLVWRIPVGIEMEW